MDHSGYGACWKLGLLSGEGREKATAACREVVSGPQQTLPLYAGKGPGLA